MVIMVSARALSAADRRRLSEWCRANDVDDAPLAAAPYVVDADAGTVTVHRYVLSDDNPAADFPELARDVNGDLVTERMTVPLSIISPLGELTTALAPASSQAA